jgi:signal transduction histidine kinase
MRPVGDCGTARVSVADTGVGIAPEVLPILARRRRRGAFAVGYNPDP